MKLALIRTLAIVSIGFSYGPRTLLAETGVAPTSPGDHGTNAAAASKTTATTGTTSASGTTGKNEVVSPADHGNNKVIGTKSDREETEKKTDKDDTNPGKPVTPRHNDPEFNNGAGTAAPNSTSTNGVSPTNPADHGNNSSPGAKPGTGTGGNTDTNTNTTVSPSVGTPTTADHGNNTGKGTTTATEQKRK